ncbi:MAG TPA: DUF6683 family protein [Caulobacter sp.]|nr:DUF6683 family protein [Caulobacter sp.]
MVVPASKVLSWKILAAALCALALAPALPARAQDVFNMGMLTNTLAQGGNIQSETARASSLPVFGSIIATPARVRIDSAAIRYRPSLAVRARNMKQFVENLRRVDPTSAGDLERTLSRRDVIAEVAGVMHPVGLDPNNLADAMALYLVTAYYGVRGSTNSQPSELRAVSMQVARAISASPDLARASDALKQEIAESMLINAVLADQAVQAAQKQPSAMPAIKAAIGKGARSAFGFDVAKLRLGPDGLN